MFLDEAVVTSLAPGDSYAEEVIREARKRGIAVRAERHNPQAEAQLKAFLATL